MKVITQTQISAYERCKRYYYLKTVRSLVWPVENAGPRKVKLGEDFHLLARQLIMGFPRSSLIFPLKDETLERWIDVFLNCEPLGKPERVFAEKEVSLYFGETLWLGKFDALTVNGDTLTVFDWKTTHDQPDPSKYRESPQTRLYRFLAAGCASRLLGTNQHRIPAENIEMVYWFPEFPDRTVRLPYSEEEYQQDFSYLKLRAQEMSSAEEADFPRTEKSRLCRNCEYRTYCFPEAAAAQAEAELMMPDEDQTLFTEDIYQGDLFPVNFVSADEQNEINF